MDNPETLSTFGTQDIWEKQTKQTKKHTTLHKKTIKMSNTDQIKN